MAPLIKRWDIVGDYDSCSTNFTNKCYFINPIHFTCTHNFEKELWNKDTHKKSCLVVGPIRGGCENPFNQKAKKKSNI